MLNTNKKHLLIVIACLAVGTVALPPSAEASGPRDCDMDPNIECVQGGPAEREEIDPGPGSQPQATGEPAAPAVGGGVAPRQSASPSAPYRTVAVVDQAATAAEAPAEPTATPLPQIAQSESVPFAPEAAVEQRERQAGFPFWIVPPVLAALTALVVLAYYRRRAAK